jgi:Holliday junction resolvasome RuvABC DNA-binding subunit
MAKVELELTLINHAKEVIMLPRSTKQSEISDGGSQNLAAVYEHFEALRALGFSAADIAKIVSRPAAVPSATAGGLGLFSGAVKAPDGDIDMSKLSLAPK